MESLDIKNYRPPFVTETDEMAWDDCTVCATLMGTATATKGETVARRDWSPMNPDQLKVLRERIRNHLGPAKQKGSTTMADMRKAFGIEYPWLHEIPYYDEQNNTWLKLVSTLLSFAGGAVILGNPADVKNPDSKMKRWTTNDNFGHAMWADHARKLPDGTVQFFIMDPLGRGDYDGEYIVAEEVHQFLWTYGGSYVKATIFPRGAWASNSTKKVDDLLAEVAALKKVNATCELQKTALTAIHKSTVEELAAMKGEVEDLTLEVSNLEEDIGTLEAEAVVMKAWLEEKDADIATISASLTTAESSVADLTARLANKRRELKVCRDKLRAATTT
jgi:hypothetical protein